MTRFDVDGVSGGLDPAKILKAAENILKLRNERLLVGEDIEREIMLTFNIENPTEALYHAVYKEYARLYAQQQRLLDDDES